MKPAGAREADELGDAQEQDAERGRLKEPRRRQPHHADGNDDENGAAQDAGHFAPAATGDGLMPPYRRSRFW